MNEQKLPKVQIIPPRTELKQRAVNFTKGFDVDLAPEQLEELEKVVQRSSDSFVRSIGHDLTESRQLVIDAIGNADLRSAAVEKCADLAYSTKALGGTFDYPLMTQIAKSLEIFLAGRTTANRRQLMVTQLHIDAIYVILASRVTGFGTSIEQATTVALAKLAARYADPRE
ncbi:transcriptional regulator [Thalassospira marina]|uniref:Transcriptional regulator n=1 Tax=Thalassospira marina TaxID=2048283 RepID=A0A2N3KRY1_9PROT|nr:transcriptional regulator [Thalassospira marina]PKR53314.1 transcriptional regulator [Thalassospira marina]